MPKLGKEHYFVRLLAKKTKIKPEDIFDFIMALPECLAEAFFEENPAEKELVHFGFVTMYWRMTPLGPSIFFFPSYSFKKCATKLKFEKKTDLAAHLYEKMIDRNKQQVDKRFEPKPLNNGEPKQKNELLSALYTEKAKENRRKRIEKRKKQKEMLRNGINS